MMNTTEDRSIDEHRDRVRTGVLESIARTRTVRHRIQIAAAAGSVVVLAAAGLGAAALTTASQSDLDHFVECYADDDLSLSPNGVTTGGNEGQPSMDVVEFCSFMWQKDLIGPGPGPDDPNDPELNLPVPRLAACLGPHGVGAGFPIWDENETAAELCTRLGLPVWDPELQSR